MCRSITPALVGWLLQGEGCGAEDLIGRDAEYEHESGSFAFVDD